MPTTVRPSIRPSVCPLAPFLFSFCQETIRVKTASNNRNRLLSHSFLLLTSNGLAAVSHMMLQLKTRSELLI